MSEELLSCPFCGNPNIAIDEIEDDLDGFPFQPVCDDSECVFVGDRFTTRSLAVEKWNRRPHKPQTAAVLAEIVDKLKDVRPGSFNAYMNGFDVSLTIEDSEAFLREQGVL